MNKFRIAGRGRRYFLIGYAATIALVAGGLGAVAQTVTGQSAIVLAGLETVVVTARRRVENVQDVPVAVTALDGAELEARGTSQIQQLQFQAPGLVVDTPNPRQTTFSIRGLGNNPAADGLSTSVGLYIDGIYLDRPGMANFDLLDLDRVEVLRGPQGTLFGRNTVAGAVSIVTRAPGFDFAAKAQVHFGDYGLQQYQASVTGPLNDRLAYRLTGYYTSRAGYLKDVASGQDLLSLHRQGLRGQLLWKAGEAFSIRLIGEYGHENDSAGSAILYRKGPAASLNPRFVSFDAWAANLGLKPLFNPAALQSEQNGFQKQVTRQYSLTALADWKLGDFTLSSITGWRDWSFVPNNDVDWSRADALRNLGVSDQVQQFSQELRIASPTGGAFNYVAGAYYFWRDLLGDGVTTYGSQYSAGLGAFGMPAFNNGTTHTLGTVSNTSYAVFAQGSWHFDPRWDLTLGVRGTYEEGNGTVMRTPFTGGLGMPPTLAPYSGAVSNVNWAPSGLGTLGHRLSENILAYATVSYGEKAGGFNAVVPQTITGAILPASTLKLRPEKAWNYELGVKATLLDRRLIVNLGAYWTDVAGYQANAIMANSAAALQSVITNVGKVRSRGFEGEMKALPFEQLRLKASFSFNEAVYRSFVNAPPVQGSVATTQNLSGRPVVQAPKWSVNLGATYVQRLTPDIASYIGGDFGFKSGYSGYIDNSSYAHVGSQDVSDFRIGATFLNYDLSVWVRNAGNSRSFYTILPAATGSGGYFAVPAEPRMFGITLKASL